MSDIHSAAVQASIASANYPARQAPPRVVRIGAAVRHESSSDSAAHAAMQGTDLHFKRRRTYRYSIGKIVPVDAVENQGLAK
ncbi:hypothetical protein OPT61_g375 [Boeremia exigua]|uniref:Uncharacterized protein n=1 Tax=Boeremia exigua TaxID=749465 RepID=A0ACC2IUE3_9PLEO|nr:hypothetical protein OPT61_g375 [Boeremia exigua]